MSQARDRRRQSMIDDVVNAAWELVHEHGLAGLSMRDLGEKVGMRRWMAALLERPASELRAAGLASAVIGLWVVWLARL